MPRVPPGTLTRQRLTDLFDGPEAIVIAQAPAGYGKTVALAHWATTTARDGVWLRMRRENLAPEALVQHLAAELRSNGLLDAANPLQLAAETLAGGMDAWDLLRRGLRSLPAPLTLAIDGYDLLGRAGLEGLADLVADLPEVDLRGTARRGGVLDAPALALRVDVRLIGATEMALTAEEAAAGLAAEPSSPIVRRVLAHGGLPLEMRVLGTTGAPSAEGRSVTTADLIDSLVDSELRMSAWDDRFVRFLQAISVADSLDPALATELAAIAGIPDIIADSTAPSHPPQPTATPSASALLDRAEADGLGLRAGPSRHGGAAFTFTPLVRESFERRLRAERPGIVPDLVLAVARRELAHGHPYAALERAVQQRAWGLASRVIRLYWNELLRNHSAQLGPLFQGTPLGVLRRQPLVTTLLALHYNRIGHHRLRALEYFALAGHAARTQRSSASTADRAVLRAIESAALRVSGRMDGATTAALDGRSILLEMGPEDRDDLGRTEPTLHNQFGTTLFYAGRTEEALDSFARSTAVGAAKGLKGGLHGMALTAGALATGGDVGEARAVMALVVEADWPDGWLTGYMGSFHQVAAAYSALESFDADGAESAVRSLDPHRETIEHWPLLAHLDTLIELLRGHPERARLALQAEMVTQRRRHALSATATARLAHTRSLIELAAGRFDTAESALGKTPSARRGIASARIDLARDRPEQALRHLIGTTEATVATTGDPPSSRSRAEALALRAGAISLTGDSASATTALAQALRFVADRQQGLALALVPTAALDALLATAASPHPDASAADSADITSLSPLLREARRHAIVTSAHPVPALTPRELALARVLSDSETTAGLAAALSVSPNTVKTQLKSLYRKLGASTRSEALVKLSALVLDDRPLDSRPPNRPR
ncbi:LuxR C-terminal-related transcriptional regulator [Herbiconiux sp. P15]|uniref:helix-turn-helix transcriptional regulator n=1 Tax=Herbiconiux liukaitaii TaxID=3342799 RepID=UPI0035B85BD8